MPDAVKTKVTPPAFIRLHADDNILVCVKPVKQGEVLELEGQHYTMPGAIDVGHKICIASIQQGEKIIKHGVAIGSAKADIRAGEHVHIHNLKSDYIDSNTRER